MSIITQYKCDRCGKIWDATDTTEQIIAIEMRLAFGSRNVAYNSIRQEQQWCRTCIISTGVYPPKIKKDEAIAPEEPLSVTEILTKLITSLGFIQAD